MSDSDVRDLPVEIQNAVAKSGNDSELTVLAHLDAKNLGFHKEGERNKNTVTFLTAIFDPTGKYMTGQQRVARVDLPDSDLPNLRATGIDVKLTFQLKSGAYSIREVVTDAEEHKMATSSYAIAIP